MLTISGELLFFAIAYSNFPNDIYEIFLLSQIRELSKSHHEELQKQQQIFEKVTGTFFLHW